jgi:nucleotide-binding universal stress UspA family protein
MILERQQVSEARMLRDLLVHVPSEHQARPVIDSAVSLAMAHKALLQAVSIGYETANIGVPLNGGAAVAAVFEMEHESAQKRADTALSAFDAEARNAGIAYSLKAITGAMYDAAAQIGAMARLADLTIVLQPDYELDTFDNAVPVELLFQCGGPVLFVPYIHKGPLQFKRIGIAWDGSRLAARALRDAAPFLKDAQEVAIININEPSKPENSSAAELATNLARRGLTAKFERANADGADIQSTILSIAADAGLDLIVMGAYGHSRLQEWVLGGVTRSMLQSMTVPTLMSH